MIRAWSAIVCWVLAGVLASVDARGQTTNIGQEGSTLDQACLTCHTDQLPYLRTAHHTTSGPADEAGLAETFRAAGEKLTIMSAPLPNLDFLMQNKGGKFFEVAESGWGTDLLRTTQPVDLVIGSGKRGQTFLYWSGNELFELPVSFWREGHRWINSPGYVDGTADFKRPVQPGCLECHVSAASAISNDTGANIYHRESVVTGLSCTTCHGSGTAHVAAERAGKPANSAILNPAHFARDRQIDLCALCHSGIQRSALAPAFSYVPGQPLANFFAPLPAAEQDRPDVHGNQVGLLQRSRCFRSSPEMTCSTCHNVHTVGAPAATYSTHCLSCHAWQSCGEAKHLGVAIKAKCIDCHMPVQRTEAIISTTSGERVQATMRTHWIKVYDSASRSAP